MRRKTLYNFKKISDYCISLENYTIAKVSVKGKLWFEVWNLYECIKRFTDPDEAKRYVIQKVKDRHDFQQGDKHE